MSRRENSPFAVFHRLEQDLQRFSQEAIRNALYHPPTDVFETDGALVVKVDLAGILPDSLTVSLSADDRILTIAGNREESREERRGRVRYRHMEIYFGPFEREIELPADVLFNRKCVTANYKDGFLVVTLPKRERYAAETRTIEVCGE